MVKKEALKKVISERLKLAREFAGLSQLQAAKLLGVSRPTISEIEASRRNVTSAELVQLSDIYDVEINWLLGEENTDNDDVESKIQLAAREISKMSDSDKDKLFKMLSAMKKSR